MKKKLFLIFLLNFFIEEIYSQSNEVKKESTEFIKDGFLKGLRKASAGDIDSNQKLKLDGVSIPIYTLEGKRVQGMEMAQMLMSGEYAPDIYVDENKETKAFVLRKATEEDKKRLAERRQSIKTSSERVGKSAKPFSVKDLKGNSYSLEELKGKIVIINFWFIGCKPCIMEMPELNKLVKKYAGKDVVFLGFALDEEAQLNTFLKKKEFLYNIIPNSENIIKEYGINSFPTHFIIDKASKIVHSTNGLSQNTVTDLDKKIESLL
jgi:thiol-disulfide isomerase/thioredoxin